MRKPGACVVFLGSLAASLSMSIHAGSFGVAPTRLDFDKGAKSGVIEVSNDDERKLSFQLKLFEWKQGPDGKDQYVESQDLIYFPQLFSVNAHDKRIIRVGLKGVAALPAERAYRLFIEEMPDPATGAGGAEVKVVLRFGVPLFVAPESPRKAFTFDNVEVAKGKLLMTIRNGGNQSAKFEFLRVRRGDAVVAEAAGWYILAGATRTFELPMDPAKCVSSGALEAMATAEGVVVKQAFTASPLLCERP